ncbi:MAG: hypothetical protein NTX66_02680, partial [Candidatus Falkowbacteria bacterium]|nr:hypothetical protein [Candidatus Falkowbacteria bacterium]
KDCLSKKKLEKKNEIEARQAAKQVELANLAQADTSSGPSLSLNDLKNIAPLDFKGRPEKTISRTAPNAAPSSYLKTDSRSNLPADHANFGGRDLTERTSSGGQDLNEGEDIVFKD